jgi:hypothetical protein
VEPVNGWLNMPPIAELTASDGSRLAKLGMSVAISGNTVVAGAPGKAASTGVGDVFVKPKTGWVNMTQTREFYVPDEIGEAFAYSVGLGGNVDRRWRALRQRWHRCAVCV